MAEPDSQSGSAQKVLRVGELTRYVKYLIEQDEFLKALSVRGELSEVSRSPSGHVYFTLKDGASQISCVLFRREAARNSKEAEALRPGDAVVVHGFLTVYESRGVYQVYVQRVVAQGAGLLFQRMQRLKVKLQEEGLFAEARKRPLPRFPRTLALITSPESNAYHDVLHRLRSQYPFVRVVSVGVTVQGEGAAAEIAMAIDIVNRLTDAEVILLVRGGGAPEDLGTFNDEQLARAVFASTTPVVTGVGHENDQTIVDFVADRRAATPSLAAAVAVPDVTALVGTMAQLHSHSTHLMHQRLSGHRARWSDANRTLLRTSPQVRLRTQHRRAGELEDATQHAIRSQLDRKKAKLDALRGQLSTLDPLSVLRRGYSILSQTETGQVVSRLTQVAGGEVLHARVSDGEFQVRVLTR